MAKRFIPLLFALILMLAACSEKQEDANSAANVKQRIDSLTGVRIAEEAQQAAEQLDRRMSIEVKQKADSIVAARTAAGTANPPAAVDPGIVPQP